jgi:hypothetical protein
MIESHPKAKNLEKERAEKKSSETIKRLNLKLF